MQLEIKCVKGPMRLVYSPNELIAVRESECSESPLTSKEERKHRRDAVPEGSRQCLILGSDRERVLCRGAHPRPGASNCDLIPGDAGRRIAPSRSPVDNHRIARRMTGRPQLPRRRPGSRPHDWVCSRTSSWTRDFVREDPASAARAPSTTSTSPRAERLGYPMLALPTIGRSAVDTLIGTPA